MCTIIGEIIQVDVSCYKKCLIETRTKLKLSALLTDNINFYTTVFLFFKNQQYNARVLSAVNIPLQEFKSNPIQLVIYCFFSILLLSV